jgi:hypothetical protein
MSIQRARWANRVPPARLLGMFGNFWGHGNRQKNDRNAIRNPVPFLSIFCRPMCRPMSARTSTRVSARGSARAPPWPLSTVPSTMTRAPRGQLARVPPACRPCLALWSTVARCTTSRCGFFTCAARWRLHQVQAAYSTHCGREVQVTNDE